MKLDHVLLARSLFGTSLAFHIIFATLGVGIPLLVVLAEVTFALTGDSDYAIMAKRWTRGFTVVLAVGITTGTIVALQLSLLWPRFMQVVGQVIALPFLIEIFAFFIEAVFMSIYVYAADRIPQRWRILSVTFVAFGAAMSALLITDANSFMNTPRGFRMENGRAIDVHPWLAVFNPALPTQDTHVIMSVYTAVPFVLATVAAVGLVRRHISKREREHHSKALMLTLALGGFFGILTAISGDLSGKFLAHYQPAKLAVAEGLFRTTKHAPLVIGGWPDVKTLQVIGGIHIPGLLSFLATDRFDGVVKGLLAFPKDQWPPLFAHELFDTMVGLGTLLIGIAILGWFLKTIRRRLEFPFPKWYLFLVIVSGFLAMCAIECGWLYAELGRQPWTIYGIMRTTEAVTGAPYIRTIFILFMLLYLLLTVATILVLRTYFLRHPLAQDIEPGPIRPRKVVWLP